MLAQGGDSADRSGSYAENGYLGPATAFEAGELDDSGALPLTRSFVGWPTCRNRHLDIPVVAEICRSPRVIEVVRTILGPDLIVWRSNIFAVSQTGQRLPWHQDQYGPLLDCPDDGGHCSVQINLSDSTSTNCVAIAPGSHRWETDDFPARGFTPVSLGDDDTTPGYASTPAAPSMDVMMTAGQFYVFHPRLLHRSVLRPTDGPDTEPPVRYSIALRIATTSTKVLPDAFIGTPERASCTLLSGIDRFGHNLLTEWATC